MDESHVSIFDDNVLGICDCAFLENCVTHLQPSKYCILNVDSTHNTFLCEGSTGKLHNEENNSQRSIKCKIV